MANGGKRREEAPVPVEGVLDDPNAWMARVHQTRLAAVEVAVTFALVDGDGLSFHREQRAVTLRRRDDEGFRQLGRSVRAWRGRLLEAARADAERVVGELSLEAIEALPDAERLAYHLRRAESVHVEELTAYLVVIHEDEDGCCCSPEQQPVVKKVPLRGLGLSVWEELRQEAEDFRRSEEARVQAGWTGLPER